MTFRKLLHKLPYFITFLLLLIMTVSVHANAVKQLKGIKFRWAQYTKPKYWYWSTEMNIWYNFLMNGQEFNDIWQDPSNKKDLVDGTFEFITTFVFDATHQVLNHSGRQTGH